ncbi:UNVERIFIED_CONTAM: hypothetical protein Sradi_7008900 [Sesamum radiatum]|uniref:Retrotransposon gag domain-containing protein n=1 Tax=Sesamum radiatum TaxID=300843 RepID=A0AAW2JD83_SESRA
MEHLSRYENATLLHRYTDGIKCRVFVITFAGAAQQWFNQLPLGFIRSFQEFSSLFLHQFASSRKVRKTELSLFAIRQGEDEPLKEYLQRFNTAALEFDALLAQAAKYINIEEAQATKKDSRREKRKEVRRMLLPRNPVPTLETENPLFQRKDSSITGTCKNTSAGRGPEVLVLIRRKKETKQGRSEPPALGDLPEKELSKLRGAKEDNNDIPRKGIIRLISGGPTGRDSHQARKSQVREAHQTSRSLGHRSNRRRSCYTIRTSRKSGPQTIHNDALVITAMIANYEVGRIFIDSGSSADILYGEAYDQMQLGDISLERVNTSLYGFAGEVVHPRGMVSLPLTIWKGPARKTCLLKFLVVDVPSAYNEEWEKYREILSTPEDVMSMLSIKGQKQSVDEAPDQILPSKNGKTPEGENPGEAEGLAKVQQTEKLLNIEIIPKNPDKTTRIGSHLDEEAKKEITCAYNATRTSLHALHKT